ncbi:extracellular solute-binding protein [Hydrogenimonas urashimensis]|uniref:extracellular solute-binding protein n=1 Tax=Hydrogenimonas urashimensis TaxID=2740515 RepID=UPI0019158042|nr:extracellular solute-binding protein [Hydrogenimonas urashimensis]
MKKKELIIGLIVLAVALLIYWYTGKDTEKEKNRAVVVVYVSEDRVFSEPILKAFEKETGIEVKALYDTEEAKSTGVMNRLIAEKSNPRADVYWANEPIRAEVLKQKGISAPYISPNAEGIPSVFKDSEGYWTGFSARARVLIVHNSVKKKPESIEAYTQSRWKGRSVIANPLFGTTTAHIAALFVYWGEDRADAFMRGMKHNDVTVTTSNGESADFVAEGRYAFALVDSDDAVNRIRQGKPVTMVYPDQKPKQPGCFIVPNAAVLIKNAPHPKEAKRLIDYLLSKETERRLAFADCAQIPLHPGVSVPRELRPIDAIRIMEVDYGKVAKKLMELQPYLKRWTTE